MSQRDSSKLDGGVPGARPSAASTSASTTADAGNQRFWTSGTIAADNPQAGTEAAGLRADRGMPLISNQQEAAMASPRTMSSRYFGPLGPGSLRSAVIALASTAFGSGVLALPWVFSVYGLPLGAVVLLFAGYASLLSQRLLANSAYATGLDDYAKIVNHTLGSGMSVALDVIIFVYAFGSVIGYFVFIEQFGPSLLLDLGFPDSLAKPWLMTLVFAVFPLTPLSLFRSLAALRYATLVNVSALVVVALVVCLLTPSMSYDLVNRADEILPEGWWWRPNVTKWSDIPQSFAFCCYSFSCHVNLFQKYRELDSPTSLRVRKVLVRAVMLEVVVYILVGACGFLALGPSCTESEPKNDWPSCTPVNVLASPRFGGVGGVISRLAMICALLICIPINLAAGRGVLQQRIFVSGAEEANADEAPQTPLIWHLLVSLGFLFGAAVIAIVYAHIDVILSFLGGGCAVTFMFTIPIAATIKLYFGSPPSSDRQRGILGDRSREGTDQIGRFLGVTYSGVIVATCIMVLCIALGYISAGHALVSIF